MKKSGAWVVRTFFIMAVSGTLLVLAIIAGVSWHFSRDLPRIVTAKDYRPLTVTSVLAVGPAADEAGKGPKESTVIGEFYTQRRYLIPYEKIPEIVIRAFTSAEDDKFFEHSGINIASMIRASIANFKAGHVVQGGSTITQQVVKSLILTSEKSFDRKIKEVILAARIERNLTKQQILYLYLNQIYLGHGAYGVQAAAKTYFRKDVSQLSVAEAALLAGLPQAPGKYSPLLNPKKAKERQLYVLRRMYENKFISQAQMTEASNQELKIFHDEDISKKYSAYLTEHLRRYLVEKYGEKAVYEDGMTVLVPTSPSLILKAAQSLREGLEAVDKRIGYRGPLEHLKTAEDIEKALRAMRLELIENSVQFQVLMADGRLDAMQAMQVAGIKSDRDLLETGKHYHAVVTTVDDKRKNVTVMIGAAVAQLPLEKMKWARPLKESPNARGEPTAPSKVLMRGDVIVAKVVENSEKGVIVELSQDPQVQGAIFSLDAQTGHVLAMEGGYDYERSEFNRATQALRQPGSSFKPIIYSAALEKGYTPASIIIDSPIVYQDADSKWKPSNFEEKFYGDTTFRQALIHSRNVPTIKIVQSLQVPKVIGYAQRIGMSCKFPEDLSISLGSASISLVDLTKAYALFPRLGRMVTPIFFTKILDRDGQVLEEHKSAPSKANVTASSDPAAQQGATGQVNPSPTANPLAGLDAFPPPNDPDQVLDPRVAYVMTHLMKEVVAFGTGHEAKNLGRPSAGKTGTTNEFIDAWYMGFTPYVVTGVWVGFDNQKSMGRGETGARAALPIWLAYMKEAVKPYPDSDFVVPPGVVFASIDPVSGKLAPPNSSNAIKEAFIEGTEPKEASEGGGVGKDTSGDSEFFKEDIE